MTGDKSNFDPNTDANPDVNPETAHTEPSKMAGTIETTTSTPVCDIVRPELKAYLDGQTGWWRQRSIRAHIAQCPMCREEMEAMRDFSDNLRSADAETLDPALRARILAAVPHMPPAPAEARPVWRSHRRPLFLAGAAASAALIGAVLYPALNSQNAFGVKSASSETSVAQTMKSAAASAPASIAARKVPLDTTGSVDINGFAGEADGASQKSAKSRGQILHDAMPAAPAITAPVHDAQSTADKAVGGFTTSSKAFRTAPGGMSDKPSAQIAQDVTVSAIPPVAPAEPATPSDITVQVSDVETRSADVEQKALAAGGKIVLSALSTGVDKVPSATLTLKIPVSRLEGFLTQVAHLGQLQSRQPILGGAVKADGETAKAKGLVRTKRQETLIPVTVNLKSSG